MASQILTIKVDKTKVRQLRKIIRDFGIAEVEKQSNIVKGKPRRGENPLELLKRLGPIKTDYPSFDALRKAAWKKDPQ